ncbi:MAG: phosphomannomutase [Beijerinckiaceae bacterium]
MSSLKFGTSGLRGLVSDLAGMPAFAYTAAFVDVLKRRSLLNDGQRSIYLGQDLRASSPYIAQLCSAAIHAAGFNAIDCGAVPTPALAYEAMRNQSPSIMITGSHIPDDRNGLKFYLPTGEIDKSDESAIAATHARKILTDLPFIESTKLLSQNRFSVLANYRDRYCSFFYSSSLRSLRIGVYQHSSVARDIIVDILNALGAEVIPLGRSSQFIPVDTEAIRREDEILAKGWVQEHGLDAIVSTDGDADRPLIADSDGAFLRGDLVGAITARQLNASTIVTPVTSNSRLETCGAFLRVMRTKVGSPFVIADMDRAILEGEHTVVGFEANGGVLLGTNIQRDGCTLTALPTRDAMLPIVCVLSEMVREGRPLKDIVARMGFASAASTRIEHASPDRLSIFLAALRCDPVFVAHFFSQLGSIDAFDQKDGVRFLMQNGEMVHFRASGNAPELRIYVEAASLERAAALLQWVYVKAEKDVI